MYAIRSQVGVQLLTRIVTFIFNAATTRCVDAPTYGIGQLSLPMLNQVALFLPKEGLRRAAQRRTEAKDGTKDDHDDDDQSALNLMWLAEGITVVTAFALGCVWLANPPQKVATIPASGGLSSAAAYRLSIIMVTVGCCIKGIGEPVLIHCQQRGELSVRSQAEGIGLVAKTAGVVVSLMVIRMHGLLAFAVGQVCLDVVWVAYLLMAAHTLEKKGDGTTLMGVVTKLLPSRLKQPVKVPTEGGRGRLRRLRALLARFRGFLGMWLTPAHQRFACEYSLLALQKLLLTEGQNLILMKFFPEEDWGVSVLVQNFASIILRVLFSPIEETATAAFSFMQRSQQADSGDSGEAKPAGPGDETMALLRVLIFMEGSIGWFGAVMGPPFCYSVVFILNGREWAMSAAPRVMQSYCVLLFLMALNGILEAFMYACATPRWLQRCQWVNVAISLSFVLLAVLLKDVGEGGLGLVYASWANMAMRILLVLFYVAMMRHRGVLPAWRGMGGAVRGLVLPKTVKVWGIVVLARLVCEAAIAWGMEGGMRAALLVSSDAADGGASVTAMGLWGVALREAMMAACVSGVVFVLTYRDVYRSVREVKDSIEGDRTAVMKRQT